MNYTKIPTKGIDREEWLSLRRTGIGGSDAGAILGLSPWAGPMNVYADKLGLVPDREETEAMRLGSDMEDYVAHRFMEKTGKRVQRSNYMYRSVRWPFMLADVDRLVIKEDAGLECKTMSPFGKKALDEGDIPPQYYCQCVHYMAVTGANRWYLAILVYGQGFYWFEIERDENEIKALVTQEKKFWEDHVLPEVPPEPDGTEATDNVIRSMFRGSDDMEIVMQTRTKDIEELLDIQARIKGLETQEKKLKQSLQLEMGDATIGYAGEYEIRWKPVTSRRIDTKRMKTEAPDLYETYSKKSTARRFDIRERKTSA